MLSEVPDASASGKHDMVDDFGLPAPDGGAGADAGGKKKKKGKGTVAAPEPRVINWDALSPKDRVLQQQVLDLAENMGVRIPPPPPAPPVVAAPTDTTAAAAEAKDDGKKASKSKSKKSKKSKGSKSSSSKPLGPPAPNMFSLSQVRQARCLCSDGIVRLVETVLPLGGYAFCTFLVVVGSQPISPSAPVSSSHLIFVSVHTL